MTPTDQVNVRVPVNARDLILRIARSLRDDTAFSGRLERFLDQYGDGSIGPLLSERVDRLERRLDAMERKGIIRTPTDTPTDTPRSAPGGTNLFGDREGPDPAWTIGEGKGRRLSLEGERELERRLEAGEDDSTIAKAMGIRSFAVQNRRQKIEINPPEG